MKIDNLNGLTGFGITTDYTDIFWIVNPYGTKNRNFSEWLKFYNSILHYLTSIHLQQPQPPLLILRRSPSGRCVAPSRRSSLHYITNLIFSGMFAVIASQLHKGIEIGDFEVPLADAQENLLLNSFWPKTPH